MTTVGYIGGLGRSGSTLLEQIAAGLDDVCVLGEVVHLWERGLRADELCSCGEPFSRCPFWQQVGELAFGGWQRSMADDMHRLWAEVDRTRYLPALRRAREGTAITQAAREYGARFAAVYAAAAQASGRAVVVDSSKHASTAYVLRQQPGIDLRVVHMIRDSRGVAYSWTKLMRRPEAAQDGDAATMHRYPPWRAALLWDAQNLAFASLARAGTPVWRLRYEDLLGRPVPTAQRLAGFLGVPADTVARFVTATTVQVGRTHQISGNPVRFQSGAVELRRDEGWRTAFPPAKQRLVTALTAPLMWHYGYFGGGDD